MRSTSAGIFAVFATTAFLLFTPAPSEGQTLDARDRSTYLGLMASEFGVSPVEIEILLESGGAIDQLPVLLFLARETGMSPTALAAGRRSGTSWMALLRRFGLDAGRLYVPLDDRSVDARMARAWGLFQERGRDQWGSIDLTDEEIVTLVHLRVLSRNLGVDPGRVLQVRGSVGTWTEVPRRLMGPR